ncbi:hypothetical protein U9M48_026566 [Paspalum notatum var. saurae]|uniref:Uncharacterized protein n=1 Tax=Paspalum notatum var. saurae TaxID=547442 RepID=A0AAQ3WZB7_PASNO
MAAIDDASGLGFDDDDSLRRLSVDVVAMEGLNATTVAAAGRTVSPVFNLTAKVGNRRVLAAWCSSGGQAVVSYAGVSLAWARVPAFCVPTEGAAAELTVVASGRGVGLSDELRSRFVTEWNMGAARVKAVIKLYYDGNGWPGMRGYDGVSFVSREITLLGMSKTESVYDIGLRFRVRFAVGANKYIHQINSKPRITATTAEAI